MNNKAGLVLFLVILLCVSGIIFAKSGISNSDSNDELIMMKSSMPESVSESVKPLEQKVEEVKKTEATVVPEKTEIPEATAEPTKKPTAVAVKKAAAVEKQETVESIIARIKSSQARRKAMKTSVKIETKYTDMDAVSIIRGEVLIKKKDKFYVKYTEPAEQEMVSDGKTLWVYTPMLSQVIKQDIEKANMNMQFYIEIENSIGFFAKYSETKLKEEDGLYVISMKPDKSKIDYDSIEVKVDKKNFLPKEMSMSYDTTFVKVVFSDTTIYTAEEIAGKKEFSDSRFVFKVPEGVDVIDGAELLGQ